VPDRFLPVIFLHGAAVPISATLYAAIYGLSCLQARDAACEMNSPLPAFGVFRRNRYPETTRLLTK
jgi:hypothetical protein